MFDECPTYLHCHKLTPQTRAGIADRARRIINNLGRTLMDLRVDAFLSPSGEPKTDESIAVQDVNDRKSRRHFIVEFAAYMQALTSIKMEGGIPRDEKRETVLALRKCPLTKLVFIGSSFPLANTWGPDGQYLTETDGWSTPLLAVLTDEDEDMLDQSIARNPSVSSRDKGQFQARFGSDLDPMLYTIASSHAETISELKFCGYGGAPMFQ